MDYIFPFEGKLIPIEVKSGKVGALKSLLLSMDEAPHHFAIRFYAGELRVTEATTPSGKKFQLLNLPYYLGTQLEKYLDWFIGTI